MLLMFSFITYGQDVGEPKTKAMSLADCIKYALKKSPDLKKLDLAHSNRKYDTLISRAAFDLGISFISSRNDEDRANSHRATISQDIPGGFTLSSTGRYTSDEIANTQQSDLSVTLSKALLGRRTLEEDLRGIRDGLVDELVALNNISREKRNIRFRIERQFYRIIRNKQGLEIEKRRLDRAKKNLEHAKERDKPLDIATAEIEIPETELNVIVANRRIATELDRLKVIMGMPPDNEIGIDEDFEYKTMEIKLKDDLFFAEHNEETFINNALAREKAERDVRITKSRTNVDLSLDLTHNVDSKGTENANLDGRNNQVISLNLSFDLGERADKARHAKSKNDLEENSIDRYILRQNKMRSLRDLYRSIEETSKAVVIQELRIKLSERQLELFKDRWENGEIDILEYIRSQNSLEDSKVRLINLKTTYMELLSEYLFEVGK